MRKLYFQNAAGKRIDLNGKSGIYATNLSGFGYTLNHFFADLSSGFFPPVTAEKDPQNTLAFTMVLTDRAYAQHQSLMDWLASAGKLTIVYDPTGKQEYYRDVVVKFVQKGELGAAGWLSLPCSFACTTPWYFPTPATLEVASATEGAGKQYDYTYGALRYGPDSDSYMSADLVGRGHIPGALEVTLSGNVGRPRLKLVGRRTGKVIGECSLPIMLEREDRLEYSSRYEDSYVRLVNPDGTVTDLLDQLILDRTPFFRIPVDEPSVLSVEGDTEFHGSAQLKIYYYFRSV